MLSKTLRLHIMILSTFTCFSHGLVYLQKDWDKNEGPPVNIETPDPNYLAGLEYSSTARTPSAAIIAPNYIITAKHWPGNFMGRQIKRIGYKDCHNQYVVVDSREGKNFDIDICRIKKIIDPNTPVAFGYDVVNDPNALLADADFKCWVNIYPKDDELGKKALIGSYGLQWIHPNWNGSKGHIPEKPAGSLHWGRNVISSVDNHSCSTKLNGPGKKNYVEYECFGGHGCSGSPWFIYDNGQWWLISFYHTPFSGPRLSRFRDWIHNTMVEMERKPTLIVPR